MNSKHDFKIVKCSKHYWEFVRSLRLDKRVIQGFIQTKNITQRQQNSYMKKYSKFYRIALLNNEPVGFIGVIKDDIRICTHPDFQKLGVGKFMIKECIKIWPKAYAKIKINNTASIRLFKSMGFSKKYVIYTRD